jgi:AcrR family transcriptional regulator
MPVNAASAGTGRRHGSLQQRLADAAVEAVHELGYAGATMAAIAERAGVTRGALQHHFGNRRVDLVASVAAQILDERQKTYEAQFRDSRTEAVFDREALKTAYRDPKTWFLIEVWIAARGDAELQDRIGEIRGRIEQHSDFVLGTAFKEIPGVDFVALKMLLRAVTRGLAVEQVGKSDLSDFDAAVDLLADALDALQRQRAGP